jgi:hypothetical protein
MSIFEPGTFPADDPLYNMVTHLSIHLNEESPGECELFRLTLAQTRLAEAQYDYRIADVEFAYSVGRRSGLGIDSTIR